MTTENKPDAYTCANCGTDINEGEFKTFGLCDNCWDKYHKPESPKEGEEKKQLDKEDFFKLIGAHPHHANATVIWDTLELHRYEIIKKSELQSLRDQLAAAIEDSMLVRQTVAKKINELAAKKEELTKLAETFQLFKKGIAKGSELYAYLRFDDEPFTPYQLVLQKIEEKECFHLAARQCESPAGDEGGNFYCVKVKSLEEENKKLKKWKESEIQLWGPVIEYCQKNGERLGIELGSSISDFILQRLKNF